MTNLKNTKTKVTVGYRKNLTGTKRGEWHGWQKFNGRIYHETLKYMFIITVLHENIFSVTQELQKCFQLTSEGKTLILKKNSTEIRFGEKMANKSGKGFLLTTKFYKCAKGRRSFIPQ